MDQFVENGCENCPHLQMQGKRQIVEERTTTMFEGLIAMTNPEKSWVAKAQGMKPNQAKGLYAIAVYDVDAEDNWDKWLRWVTFGEIVKIVKICCCWNDWDGKIEQLSADWLTVCEIDLLNV